MWNKIIVALLMVALINLMIACTKTAKVGVENVNPATERIIAVTLANGEIVKFTDRGGILLKESKQISGLVPQKTEQTLYQGKKATTTTYQKILIPVDSVSQVWVERADPLGSFVAVIAVAAGIILIVGLIAVALKESCPFVYSWDGSKYVFDAEPLGGAICKGLQRSELSRLDYVKPVDGTYRLRLQNEVEETQYLDEMKLFIIDHDPDKIVVPDTSGQLHLVSEPVSPYRAYDEQNRDILPFVINNDQSAWQTRLIEQELNANHDTRHHLTFEFEKPENATSARIIVNAGTAIWGSNMIREMLQMRGDGVDRWYEAVNNWEPEIIELAHFNLREEMYLLKLHLEKGEEVIQRGMIFGGGPYVSEDRVIEIDVSDIPGNNLNLKMHPPKSFWTIDYISVEYDDNTIITPQIERIVAGNDMTGADITGQLGFSDNDYFIMPTIGDWAEVSFASPAYPSDSSLKRSVFLSTTGYYEVQIDKTQPEQKELIAHLIKEPGEIASYSINRLLEWQENEK
ncbi:MAG: hypothetical protein KOO62_12160 [candidate division Zixibacteria bacterium]|nr:hypothetical protein [candidate division Zixibacteria bacterium]